MTKSAINTDPAKDYEAVLIVHRKYIQANSTSDTALLATIWDDDPGNVFFNLTGHNYRGLAHWTKLWEYYSSRIGYDIPWITWDENITINGDVAWVTCVRLHQARWTSTEADPIGEPRPQITRSTEILQRTDEQWKVVHAHFSYAAMTPRPGNV